MMEKDSQASNNKRVPDYSNHWGSFDYDFLVGGGELGERMRSTDWSKTPLGPVENWPQSLRSALSICLGSAFPIALYWGQELVVLYNDAWSPIPGSKHPWALGRTGYEVWPEIWDTIEPLFKKVTQSGEGVWQKDQLLLMSRHGYIEECYFNFTFSPIRGETGVEGIFNAVVETTYQVINERRTQILRQLAERTSSVNSAQAVCKRVAETISSASMDIPFALLYLLDAAGNEAQLIEAVGIKADLPFSPARVSFLEATKEVWPLAEVARTGKAKAVNNLTELSGSLASGGKGWDEPPHTALVLPIARPAQEHPYGLLVAGVSPRRLLDTEYQAFFELFTNQIATAIGNALAYEEERKRAEALAEINQTKTTFFSNVSHEFRTPLTLMLGPIEDMLAEKATLSPAQQERTEILHRNSLRLLRLVNALLDFSRIEAGRLQAFYEPTDLAAFTTDLASGFRSAIEKVGMKLIVEATPLEEPIYVDREMWEKIVLNLLSNAFKYTLEGSITVSLKPVDNQVELSVTDTGIGIPEKELPHLFERFHRVEGVVGRTFEGTGIGLALVQELVKLHGGTLTAKSVVGQGSAFTVTLGSGTGHLPQERISANQKQVSSSFTAIGANAYLEEVLRWLPDPQEAPAIILDAPTLPVAAESSLSNDTLTHLPLPHILLADDNTDMREYVARLLSQKYEVEVVPDGQAALKAISKRKPDLVLTDVMMPKLNGFELLKALRANDQTHTIPVIMLSARAGEEANVEGMEAGADDYLIKPFSARELLARVSAHLEMARVRKEAQVAVQRSRDEAERQRQQLYQTFMQVPLAVSVLGGPNLVYELINPITQQMIGYRDVLGKPLKEAFPELTQEIWDNHYKVYQTGQPYIAREFALTLDWDNTGQVYTRYWDVNYEPRRNESGQIDGIISVSVEVTSQVKARQRVEEQNRVLEMITSGAPQTEALEFLIKSIERQSIEGTRASILLVSEDGKHLRHGAAPSLPKAYNEAIDGIEIGPNVGSCGTAAFINKAVIVVDVTTSPLWQDFKDLAQQHNLRACWSTPIYALDQSVLGTFAMYYDQPRTPDAQDWQIIEYATRTVALVVERKKAEAMREDSLTRIAAVAQENQKLYEQEQAARTQAEEANRLKDEFLATVSHELRTPLTAFLGYAQLLKSRKRDDLYIVTSILSL